MDYNNYIELYEAVYFFNIINRCFDNKLPLLISKEKTEKIGINESIYRAVIRILVVNNILDYDGSCFVITNESKERIRYILDNINKKNQDKYYAEMFNKAIDKSHFFFDSISELEYEIYSRCNFQVTFETGKEAVKHINLANKKVLELGGNSGGLGSAILTNNKNCLYTIVDAKIPCTVGNEFKESSKLNITFEEGNIFDMKLKSKLYDYIIFMNLLHDFDDINCLKILTNCKKYYDCNTKFLIIEDILTGEFEPKDIIMHGLRLSVECRGGKQRTIEELISLFININFTLEKSIILNNTHTMLIMSRCGD